MNPFLTILQGPSGKGSSLRLMAMYIVFVIVTTWAVISIRKNEMQVFSEMDVLMVTTAIAGKVWQKGKEHAQ